VLYIEKIEEISGKILTPESYFGPPSIPVGAAKRNFLERSRLLMNLIHQKPGLFVSGFRRTYDSRQSSFRPGNAFRYTHNLWDITQNASAERRFELKKAAGRVIRRESMAKLDVSPTLDPDFRLRVLDS